MVAPSNILANACFLNCFPTSISEPNKVQKFQFQTSAILLFTDVRKLHGPEISQVYRVCYNFWKICGGIFSNYIGEINHFTLDLLKRSDTYAGPSEKFLFVDHPKEDHNEREFKPPIIGEILDLPKKSSKTRETSIISGPQLNIIASLLELLKIFSEVIVTSKCGPLARIEKQAML